MFTALTPFTLCEAWLEVIDTQSCEGNVKKLRVIKRSQLSIGLHLLRIHSVNHLRYSTMKLLVIFGHTI